MALNHSVWLITLRQVFIAVCCLVCLPLRSRCQTTTGIDWKADPEWTRLYDGGLDALISERYSVAADSLELALEHSRRFPRGDSRTLLCLERLAEVYRTWGKSVEYANVTAELDSLRQEFPVVPFRDTNERVKSISPQYQLGMALDLYGAGKLQEAKSTAQRALFLEDSLRQTPTAMSSQLCFVIGMCCAAQRNHLAAESWMLRSLREAAEVGDGENFFVAMTNVRAVYRIEKTVVPLLDSCLEQISVRAATSDTLRDAAFRVHDLIAGIAVASGRFNDAQKHYASAVAIAQGMSVRGNRTGDALNSLGYVEMELGHLDRAESRFNRVLSDFPRSEMNLRIIGTALNNLAVISQLRKDFSRADSLFAQAIDAMRAAGDGRTRNFTKTLVSAASSSFSNRRYEHARALLNEAFTIDTANYGFDHADVVRDLDQLAHLDRNQGRYEDAETRYKTAVEIAERLKLVTPITANVYEGFATLLRALFRENEAEVFEAKAGAIRDRMRLERQGLAP